MICKGTRNIVDGGIQSSSQGGDVWLKPTPVFKAGLGKSYRDHPLTADKTLVPDILVLNKTFQDGRRRKKQKVLSEAVAEQGTDLSKALRPSRMVPDKNQLSMTIVIREGNGSDLTREGAKATPAALKDTLCFGSMSSEKAISDPFQTFFCLDPNAFDLLCKTYQHGLILRSGNHADEIDAIIESFSNGSYKAVSLDKIAPASDTPGGIFYGFTRIFAGEGSPSVDDKYTNIISDNGLQISYTLCGATENSRYTPLSIAMFNSSSHGIAIQQEHVSMVKAAVGTQGLYGRGRSAMIARGSLTYEGPRKNGSMRQPTVAEGPNESVDDPLHKFSYHRKSICHSTWPWVFGFFEFIVGATTLTAYYFHQHMAKFYTVSNSPSYRKKFCPRGIIAIDFSSSCHTDCNDNLSHHRAKMEARVTSVVYELDALRKSGTSWVTPQLEIFQNCLNHLSYWGLCLPTTCCYQYIKQRNDVEVYQWFLCPGLGITYRIKNYWVHIFLASLFSHCTSGAIYIVDDTAYFGSCPFITMFSWGGN